jgi:hypothetical protein
MPAPGISTFDGNPNANPATTVGYRPGAPDFNGCALQDDPVQPPDPTTMPTAAQQNTLGAQHVSVGKMIACATFGVNASASPTLQYWQTAANLIVSNPFTITRVGPGHYQITWPANTFPLIGWPQCNLVFIGGAHNYGIQCAYISNGVEVTTQQDGVLTDLNFRIELY